MDASGKIKTLGNTYRKLMKFTDTCNDEPTDDEEEIDDDLSETYDRLEQVKQKIDFRLTNTWIQGVIGLIPS